MISFTFKAIDSHQTESNVATVSITVNPPPMPVPPEICNNDTAGCPPQVIPKLSVTQPCPDNQTQCPPSEPCNNQTSSGCPPGQPGEIPPLIEPCNNETGTGCPQFKPIPPVTEPCIGNVTEPECQTINPPIQLCEDNMTLNVTCQNPNPTIPENVPPVADAGKDQEVDEGSLVTLDASNSHDEDGNITSYSWTQTGGIDLVALTGADSSSPVFYAPQVHNDITLKFELTVTDNTGHAGTDDVDVLVKDVNNIDRIIDASGLKASLLDTRSNTAYSLKLLSYSINDTEVGVEKMDSRPDFSLNNSAVVMVTPTNASTELNVNNMRLSRLDGTDIVLNNIDKDKWIINAPVGVYILNIDAKFFPGEGIARYGATIQITGKENLVPVAKAGEDQSVKGNVSVTLDGSKSTDPDGTISTYQWIQINEKTFVTVTGVDTPNPIFISPSNLGKDANITFRLTVTDNNGANDTDDVTIFIKNTTLPKVEGSVVLNPIPDTMSVGQFYEFKGILNLSIIPDGSYIQIRNGNGEQTDELITFAPVNNDGKFTAGWTAVPREEMLSIYAAYVDISGNEIQSKIYPLKITEFKSTPGLAKQAYSTDVSPLHDDCAQKSCIEIWYNEWKKDNLNVYIMTYYQDSRTYMQDAKDAVIDLQQKLKQKTGYKNKWNFHTDTTYGFPPTYKTDTHPIDILIDLKEYAEGKCGSSDVQDFRNKKFLGYVYNDVFTNPPCDVDYATKHELIHSIGIGHTYHEGNERDGTNDMLCSREWYQLPGQGAYTCQEDKDDYVDFGKPTEFDVLAILDAYGLDGFEEPNNKSINVNFDPRTNHKYYCEPLRCEPTKANIPPTSDAGLSISARIGTKVILDGTKSFDPDGVITSYSWIQLSAPKVKSV